MSTPIVVEGHDNPLRDCARVQEAVDKCTYPDVIVLHGTFNFGDHREGSKRKTVHIRKPVVIVGEVRVPNQSEPVPFPLGPFFQQDPFHPDFLSKSIFKIATHIKGGGERAPTPLGDVESGPFRVESGSFIEPSGPVIIAGISFSGWAGEAISALSCKGLAVINCEFTNPVPTTPSGPLGDLGLSFVHAIMAIGSECQGSFHAIDNVCVFGDYAPLPTDEQLLACVMSNFRSIEIVGNRIHGHDEGLEVILNGFALDGSATNTPLDSILIKNNKIELSNLLLPNENWKGHFGIVCCRNRNSEATTISWNQITATGPATAFLLSGEHLTVTDNESALNAVTLDDSDTYPLAGILLGSNSWPSAFPAGPGPSLNNSVISNNTFSGAANFGMVTLDTNPDPPAPPNESHNNIVEDNDFSAFRATVATLLLTPGTHDNTFKGCFRTSIDMGWNNSVSSYCPLLLHRPPGSWHPFGMELKEALNRFRVLGSKIGALADAAERHAELQER